jgi:hypothetical protein
MIQLLDTGGGEHRARLPDAAAVSRNEDEIFDGLVAGMGPESAESMWPLLVIWLAGRAAQRRAGHGDAGCDHDVSKVRALTAAVTGTAYDADALFNSAAATAEILVRDHWRDISRLAAELMIRRQLSGDEIAEIICDGRVEMRYERRDGRTIPVRSPAPERETSVYERRCEGFVL